MPTSLEICVDSLDCALNACKAGAARLELCAALSEEGLTPSFGFMRAAAALPVPVYAMIRPRVGGFVYSDAEIAVMKADIQAAKQAGLDGVVFGVLCADGTLNLEANAALIAEAQPLKCTLHRAFDEVTDPYLAMEQAIELGFERILTSGQKPNVADGVALIAELVDIAKDRILIMPGAGIEKDNVVEIIKKTGVSEIHGTWFDSITGTGMFDSTPRRVVSKSKITEILDLIA